MIVILGMDGLEWEYVKKFNCKHLMQTNFGKTDLSDFSESRTIVLWSSFLSGKNMEKRILALKDMWSFKLSREETFFPENHIAIDVPGYSSKLDNHKKERQGMKDFFDKKISLEQYDAICFANHKENKKEFFSMLEKKPDVLMVYFGLADVIGHLSFGMESKMKLIYKELDEIAGRIKGKKLIVSDHGMRPVGRFGDHNSYGFWSVNFDAELTNPKITELRKVLEPLC
jgi:hypothetical protein